MRAEDAEAMTLALMASHGLTGWCLTWTTGRRRGGTCYRKARVIAISRPYVEVNDESGVREIVLHEIAHALTKGGHTAEWSAKAKEIGASGSRLFNDAIVRQPSARWKFMCMACAVQGTRHRRPRWKSVCTRCKRELVVVDVGNHA